MKPFDLEKALAGEPVKLRDGSKAWVKYVMPDDYKGMYPLRGIRRSVISDTNYSDVIWTKDGNNFHYGSDGDSDIMCMWGEPRPRVQLDLPCPLKEPQEGMWLIYNGKVSKSNLTLSAFIEAPAKFKQRLYFASQEDAQEWVDAIESARR